mgnify:CR=1 FL=1
MATANPRWIDLSHPLTPETPAFPGDPPIAIEVLDSTDTPTGGGPPAAPGQMHLNCSRLGISTHCGTHLDAPFHFYGNGRTIDQVGLDQCSGPAVVAKLGLLAPDTVITPQLLAPWEEAIGQSRRLLLDTGWYRRWGQEDYFIRHPVLTGATGRWLVECGLQLIGVDFPSLDHPPCPAHVEILGAGVLIVENLTNLEPLPEDEFEFLCLPLALAGRDGSPVRAAARTRPAP